MYVATGGPNVKWGHRCQMGEPDTTAPSLATDLPEPQDYKHILNTTVR